MKKHFKRSLTLLLSLLLCLGMIPSASAETEIVASGTCGANDNLSWILDSDGTMTISGSGRMKADWDSDNPQWSDYTQQIKSLVISEGVTNVGRTAFVNCTNLTRVSLAESVTEIGWCAFQSCENLEDIELPSQLITIDDQAFHVCTSLKNINIPSTVTEIGWGAFASCSNLTSITIPSGVSKIQRQTFSDCQKMKSITIPRSVTSVEYWSFQGCDSLEDVYYGGTEAEWAEINIASKNDPLLNATIHFTQPQLEIPTGKYAIRVVDKNNNRLSGAAVTYDGQSGTTDKLGVAVFDRAAGSDPVITVKLDGYYEYDSRTAFTVDSSGENYRTIRLLPGTCDPQELISAVISAKVSFITTNTDVLTGTKTLNLKNDGHFVGDLTSGDFQLKCRAVSPDKASEYQLWQNSVRIATSKNGIFQLNVSDGFVKNGGCFVRVVGTDGSTKDTPINLKFSGNEIVKQTSFNLNAGKGFTFKVADDIPFVGGSEIGLDLVDIPIDLTVSEDKVHLGFNISLSGGKSDVTDLKKSMDNFCEAGKMNLGSGDGKKLFDKLLTKSDFQLGGQKFKTYVVGYAELDYGSDTGTGELYILIQYSTKQFGFNTLVGVIPVTVHVQGKVSAQGGGKLEYTLSSGRIESAGIDLTVKPSLEAFGGVGVGSVVGVGAYGSAELEVQSRILGTDPGLKKVDLTGELGVEAYAAFLSYSHTFAHQTWHLYTGNDTQSLEPTLPAIYSAAAYEPMDLSYLAQQTSWNGAAVSVQSDEPRTSLTTMLGGAYNNAQPTLAANENGIYAAFLNADKNTNQIYVMCTAFNGTEWTQPVRLDSEAVLDGTPQLLAADDGTIWLAYSKTAPGADITALVDYAQHQSIVVGRLDPDTLTLTDAREYTSDDFANRPMLTMAGGVPTLVWLDSVVTDADSVLTPKTNTVCYASLTADGWSDPAALAEIEHPVADLAAGEDGVACNVDTDDDFNTSEDRSLISYSWSGSASELATGVTGALSWIQLPGQNGAEFVWNGSDALCSATASVDAAGISGNYTVLGDSIYYTSVAENGSDLWAVRQNADGTWSDAVQLTDGGQYLEHISVADWNGSECFIGLNVAAEIGDTLSMSKDLVWGVIQPVSDLKIVSVDYDGDGKKSGETIPVTVTVQNAGDHTASGVTLSVDDAQMAVSSDTLAPGQTTTLTYEQVMPNDEAAYQLTVQESGTSLIQDAQPEDNSTDITLGLANLAVELKQEQVGESHSLIAVVTNTGIASADGELTITAPDGSEYQKVSVGTLASGDSKLVQFTLDEDMIGQEGTITATCAIVSNARTDQEEQYSYDNTATVFQFAETAAVTGTLKSRDESVDAQFLLYPADMSDAEIRADLALDKPEKTLYTGTGGEVTESNSGYTQSYTFDSVAAGSYKLVLAKDSNQFVPHIKAITVDANAQELGELNVNRLGDVSGDGKINVRDVAMVHAFVRGSGTLDDYQQACADFNGDDKVNVRDVAQLHQTVRNA